MTRTDLWFLTISIIFVSMMAALMPGEQKNQNVHGRMTVNWHENYSLGRESFTDETWMPNCYLLQRAVSRAGDAERERIEVSCDEQTGGAATGPWRQSPPHDAGLRQRHDDADGLRSRADCRPGVCNDLKNRANIGLNDH